MQVSIRHHLFANAPLIGNDYDVSENFIEDFHCILDAIIKSKLASVQYIIQFLFVVNHSVAVKKKSPGFINFF